MTDDAGSARKRAQRKQQQRRASAALALHCRTEPHDTPRDQARARLLSGHRRSNRLRYTSLIDTGGHARIQRLWASDRTGWSLCRGTRFLGGGCHFDGI